MSSYLVNVTGSGATRPDQISCRTEDGRDSTLGEELPGDSNANIIVVSPSFETNFHDNERNYSDAEDAVKTKNAYSVWENDDGSISTVTLETKILDRLYEKYPETINNFYHHPGVAAYMMNQNASSYLVIDKVFNHYYSIAVANKEVIFLQNTAQKQNIRQLINFPLNTVFKKHVSDDVVPEAVYVNDHIDVPDEINNTIKNRGMATQKVNTTWNDALTGIPDSAILKTPAIRKIQNKKKQKRNVFLAAIFFTAVAIGVGYGWWQYNRSINSMENKINSIQTQIGEKQRQYERLRQNKAASEGQKSAGTELESHINFFGRLVPYGITLEQYRYQPNSNEINGELKITNSVKSRLSELGIEPRIPDAIIQALGKNGVELNFEDDSRTKASFTGTLKNVGADNE